MNAEELVKYYEQMRISNRLWFLNPTAYAGRLLKVFGEYALAKASVRLDESSEQQYLFNRSVFGILQDLECSRESV